ncbi:MAG: hypothetical protein IJ386_06560 [Clostridia bacterium]|nr:hypothetical protein [Clostridia bacterium]
MTNYDKLLEEVRLLGMDQKWAKMFVKKLSDDEKAFPMTDDEKKWAMTKGFYPGRIKLYGLTDENCGAYLPDYQYFMLHPLNHHFKIWVNDKLSLKYVLNSNGCEDTMPEYYLYVENDGTYTYLMDAPADIAKDKDFILNLLRRKGCLAMKPNSGTSGGLGFIKLELRDGKYYENNKPIDHGRYTEIIGGMRNYIITEYVRQHESLARIWGKSECTLRVIMIKCPKADPCAVSEWRCTVSYARFGSSISGGASNLSSGGIGIGFDFETGRFNDFAIRYKKFCPDGNTVLRAHPDTGVVWKGEGLPNWDFVKSKIQAICDHVSSLSYLGFDVIISEDGMKLCEINTHPACDYEQVMCGPILAKPYANEYFQSKGITSYSGSDFYDAYMKCQE